MLSYDLCVNVSDIVCNINIHIVIVMIIKYNYLKVYHMDHMDGIVIVN